MDKRKIYLYKYAAKICKKIGVKPDDDVFKGTVFAKEGLKFPYKHLILSAFMANWDPVYNADALDIITHKLKFIKFLKNTGLSSGAPPDSLIVNYLNLAINYFKHGLLISNISHASYIDDKIKSISNSKAPIIIYGTPSVFKYAVAKIIHYSSERSKAPFIDVDCSHYNDNQLCSVVFGTANVNNKNDCQEKLALANKGTLYIKNLQDSGKYFQGKLYKLINENIYSKEGATEFEIADTTIICSRELRNEDFTTYKPQLNTDLFYCLFSNHINMPSLSLERSDIPLLIYLSFERAKRKHGVSKKINDIEIPYYLIKFWLTEEKWEDNYLQIQYSCDYYLKEYLKYYNKRNNNSDFPTYRNKLKHSTNKGLYNFYYGKQKEKHKKLIDFLNMSDSTGIIAYLSSSDLDPYFTVKHSDLLYFPFLSFALVSYNTDDLKPEIEYSAYQELSPFQNDYYYENKWFPRRDLAIKAEKPSLNEQLKSTLGRIKTDTPNIKKIIAEIDKKSRKFINLLVVPINRSKPIPLKFDLKRKAGLSLLVFLMYEKSKAGKSIDINHYDWNRDWLSNSGELEFPPFKDVCGWFGYHESNWRKHKPGWWFNMDYVSSTITKLSPMLEKNNISPNIITIKPRIGDFSVYQLHEDIAAEIIIK